MQYYDKKFVITRHGIFIANLMANVINFVLLFF